MVQYAVCMWSNLASSDDAAPGDAARITRANLHGRVVVVGDVVGRYVAIRYGDADFIISATQLTPIEHVAFDVGEPVLYKGAPATVRDVLWHFKDARPNYYVAQADRKISKRLSDTDLERYGG